MQSREKALLKSYMIGALKEGGEYFFTFHEAPGGGEGRRSSGLARKWEGLGRGFHAKRECSYPALIPMVL